MHWIATATGASIVIKGGGAQGSHGVHTSRGESFAFNQWGCGTLDGIPTHISSRFIVSPVGLINESRALIHGGFCIDDPFGLLTIDQGAVCATPLHGIASHLKELSRGNNPRGTIGTGVGEAYRYSEQYPHLTIHVRDLLRPDLREMLVDLRRQIRCDLAPIIEEGFLPEDRECAAEEISLLNDDRYLDCILNIFQEAGKRAKIVDHDYLRREILSREGIAVVENSHGVLTDHYNGFHPHTSAIRTLPCFTGAMLKDAGYAGQIVKIGVFRAYAIRHGAGPLPTHDPSMAEDLLPGSHKSDNRWQGKIRVGPLDLVLLRYAIKVCGGPEAFDGLAVTWFDQIQKNGVWEICDRYSSGTDDRTYFSPAGEIIVREGIDDEQLKHQEDLCRQLFRCVPEIDKIPILPDASRENLYSLCSGILEDRLGVPVKLISFGPTEKDKLHR